MRALSGPIGCDIPFWSAAVNRKTKSIIENAKKDAKQMRYQHPPEYRDFLSLSTT